MAVRQYEHVDCAENAVIGARYEIATTTKQGNGFGEVDVVSIFGNPKTRNIVWVPYGSRISIPGEGELVVLRGKLNRFTGNRLFTRDQDIDCLKKPDGSIKSLLDLEKKKATVLAIHDSLPVRIERMTFDWWHNKLEEVDNSSFAQLERYGVLKFMNKKLLSYQELSSRLGKLEGLL